MKKLSKILLAAIACFVLAGLAIIGAFAFGALNRDKWEKANRAAAVKQGFYAEPEYRKEVITDAVTRLDIHSASEGLEVRVLSVNDPFYANEETPCITLEYYDFFEDETSVAVDASGKLTVTQKTKNYNASVDLSWVLRLFDGEWNKYRMLLTVPDTLNGFGPVVLKSTSGRLTCVGLKASSADITDTSGKTFVINNNIAGELNVKSTSGSTELADVAAGVLNVVNTSGRVTMANVTSSGSLDVKATSGSLDMSNVRAGATNIVNTSGRVIMADVTAAGGMDVKATSGSLNMTLVTVSGKLDILNTSGRVIMTKVTAGGDIEVKATSGSIEMTGVRTAGNVQINNSSGRTVLNDISCVKLTGKNTSGKVELTGCDIKEIDYTMHSDSLTIVNHSYNGARITNGTGVAFDISTNSGRVTVFGSRMGEKYDNLQWNTAEVKIKVKLSSGNFSIS